MHHMWLYICMAVLLPVGTLVMSPPTFISDWFFRQFEVHPNDLTESTVSSVSKNSTPVVDEQKHTLINDFSAATFLFQRYSNVPQYAGDHITISATKKGRPETYDIYPSGKFLDVVKNRNNKTVVYQIASPGLRKWFT